MLDIISVGNTLDAVIPITRFNRGEANKIFDEVQESGCKIVVKNNNPTCVLLAPERFKAMVDMIEDQYLLTVAEERMKYDVGETRTFDEVLSNDGLTFADIDAMEDVEIV